jgi:hypothetical protein
MAKREGPASEPALCLPRIAGGEFVPDFQIGAPPASVRSFSQLASIWAMTLAGIGT